MMIGLPILGVLVLIGLVVGICICRKKIMEKRRKMNIDTDG